MKSNKAACANAADRIATRHEDVLLGFALAADDAQWETIASRLTHPCATRILNRLRRARLSDSHGCETILDLSSAPGTFGHQQSPVVLLIERLLANLMLTERASLVSRLDMARHLTDGTEFRDILAKLSALEDQYQSLQEDPS